MDRELRATHATSGRLAHFAENFGGGADQRARLAGADEAGEPKPQQPAPQQAVPQTPEPQQTEPSAAGAQPSARRPALALTAEGPRRADLVAWASAHRASLATMRLLAPAGIGAMLADQVGLTTQPLKSGTVGPTATAGLAAAGDINAMIAFSDPIELRPGDTTTRALTRLAIFWDIPIASNRATADVLLATLTVAQLTPPDELPDPVPAPAGRAGTPEPVRGAVKLWVVRAMVDDVPGRLAILAASLARRAINILSVQVHLTPDGPLDELLVAASPVLSESDLTAAVIDGGARAPRIAAADAHALVDAPTRALTLATRLVRTPEDVPAVLLSLLPGARLSWRAEAPEGHDDNLHHLWLVDPTGGGFLLTRPETGFTPAECARAFAMMDVATVSISRPGPADSDPDTCRWVLPDGVEVTIRRATPDDVDGVVALHARCSMTSRLRRYLAGTRCPTDGTLARLLSPAAGRCLVVEGADGRLVGMANLIWDADSPELALLIEDSWHGRRLGTILARRLAAIANEAGAHSVRTVIHTGNTPMVRIMAGLGHRLHREYDGGLLTLIATLQPPSGHTQRLPNSMRLIQSA